MVYSLSHSIVRPDKIREIDSSLFKNIYPKNGDPDFIYKEGIIPVILTAPHATAHIRRNDYGEEFVKPEDILTGAIVQTLGELTGAHIVYTKWKSRMDPARYSNSPFREKLREIIYKFPVRILIDIHGMPFNNIDLDIGTGGVGRPYLKGNDWIINDIINNSNGHGITKIGDNQIFPAKFETLSKFAFNDLDLISLQIEISREYRKPESNFKNFETLVNAFVKTILEINSKLL